jgi:hypothetical protein
MTKHTFPPTARWHDYYTEEEFRSLVATDAKWPTVMEKTGYSLHTMRYWQRKFGLSRRRKVKRKEIIALYRNTTLSQRKIASRVGNSVGTVSKVLRDAGLTTGQPMWARIFTEEEYSALVVDSDNWPMLQARLGCHRRTLRRHRDKYREVER